MMMSEESATKLDAKIVEKPAFTLVGMAVRTTPGNPNMPQLWMDFDGQQQRVRGRTEPGVYYGATNNCDMQTNEFDYVAGVQVEPGQTAPEGMVLWEIPAQTYAVFETTLPQIGPAYAYIYETWLPGSDFVRTDGPEFELYDEAFNAQDPASKMTVWVPVKEK